MEKIASFKVNHLKLKKGLYVSRIDNYDNVTVTTFDIRLTAPNTEPVVDQPALHTIEHLGATYFRNSEIKNKVVYFGPMGCRTGCYLVLFDKWDSEKLYPYMVKFCDFVIAFEGEIPGAKPEECGNYSEQNLNMAKYYIQKYKDELVAYKRFIYEE